MRKKKVMVFGIFDGIHKGHRDFFRQACQHGGELIVVVGREEICRKLKNKTPKHSEEERRQLVLQEPLVDRAVLGDEELSTYKVLEELQPDVICFGYDQQALKEDIKRWIKNKKQPIEIYSCKKLDF